MPKSGFDFPKRPLFPLDPIDSNGSNIFSYKSLLNGFPQSNDETLTGRRIFLYASRVLRVIQLNWKIFTSALVVTLLAIIWYYPVLFLLIAFVVYSLLLIVTGKFNNLLLFKFFRTPFYLHTYNKINAL